MLFYDTWTIEDLFYCALAWSKTCLLFSQQFLRICLELVEDNSEHDLAGMADWADGMIVLTLLEVAFLWQRYDELLCPLLQPFLCLPVFLHIATCAFGGMTEVFYMPLQ